MKRASMFLSVFLIVFLLVSLTFSWFQIGFVAKVKANPNWLTGWSYRQEHNFTGATGAGSNYQMFFNVYKDTGTSSGDKVYLKNHCTDFPNDIRFTDNDETTLLDYWVEDSNTTWAGVWVEVADSLSSGTVPIYVYYGKSGASTTSNGNNTFNFFDDFTGESIDSNKWTNTESAWTLDTVNDLVKTDAGNKELETKYPANLNGYRTLFYWKSDDVTNARSSFSSLIDGTTGTYNILYYQVDQSNWDYYITSWGECDPGKAVASDTWYVMDEQAGTTTVKLYQDGEIVDTRTYTVDGLFSFRRRLAGSGNYIYLSWVAIGKYVDPEPTHGNWGSEETSGAAENSITQSKPDASSTETQWTVNFNFTPTYYDTPKNVSVQIFNSSDNSLVSTRWNTSALVNVSANNQVSYTFSVEQNYKWHAKYFNTSGNSWISSSNWTLTVDVPPRYQNVDSNSTSIAENGTILLYGQGYDGIGLDYAWLWTNETGGNGKNYTFPDNPYGTGFTYIDKFEAGANQGVEYNGTYFWCTDAYGGNGYTLYMLYANGTEKTHRDNCQNDGTDMNQINGIYLHTDGKLYIGSNLYSTTEESYIKVYDADDLTYLEEHQVLNHSSEGCGWHDGYWWVVYTEWKNCSKYNSAWSHIADYALTYTTTGGTHFYQSMEWIPNTDYVYMNLHEGLDQKKCDVYYWNGTGFEEVTRLDQVNAYCTQGMCIDPTNTSVIWWAERHSSATCYITNSTIDGVSEGYYDSPFDCSDAADTWTWSNFTWCNTTITSGTTIQWRIYYNDTYGNENGTSIHSFTVSAGAQEKSFYGVINSQFTINHASTCTFNLYSTLNPTFTISSIFTSGAILNFFGSITETITINYLKAVSFNRESIINEIFTVTGTYTSGTFLEFFGSIIQQFTVTTTKAFSFTRYALINEIFIIHGQIEMPGLLNIYGIINLVFDIVGYSPIAAPLTIDVVLGIAAIGFIIAIVALAVAINKKD